MDWSNEMVLEFLQYYESEPVIWNPLHENHKKKHLVNDAWRRIENSLSWECSIEELKKKKDSLMAYYRIHITKLKKLAGSGTEDEFKPPWFAFAAMDSFLRPNYETQINIDNEVTITNDSQSENFDTIYITSDGNSVIEQTSPVEPHAQPNKRKHLKVTKEIATVKHHMNEVFEHIKRAKTCEEQPLSRSLNEYEIFGNLVASKIQKIENPVDREILMNDINNVIFKAVMKSFDTLD